MLTNLAACRAREFRKEIDRNLPFTRELENLAARALRSLDAAAGAEGDILRRLQAAVERGRPTGQLTRMLHLVRDRWVIGVEILYGRARIDAWRDSPDYRSYPC